MRTFFILLFLLLSGFQSFCQDRYFTRNGTIEFYSETSVEDIKAINNQASCILDIENGDIAFSVQMKGFQFAKALMQEHFNENYVESDKYPAATFKGKILNYDKTKLTSGDDYEVEITGDLSLHGVTKQYTAQGKLKWNENRISGHSVFMAKVADFDIKIPATVINNIAESVRVTVDIDLELFKK